MNALVIVAHPNLADSPTQQFLKQGAKLTTAKWHYLDPLQEFSPATERQLLVEAERIILQFPLYWYGAPAILKKWQEQILSTNFVQQKLKNKQLGIVVNTGLPEKDFHSGSKVGFSVEQLLAPYQALAHQAHMHWLNPLTIYQFQYLTDTQQMQLLMDYQRYLVQPYPDTLKTRSRWYLKKMQDLSFRDEQSSLIQNTLKQTTAELENNLSILAMIKAGEDEVNG
ncbi:NAD(P)H-dependent oxidoreductase [Bombilactobacillus thymidiniphilus]|uniref:NAD(P)H-dependent oxidoreductase n=1 Tax=Bombilactobacillus thymidiniphilus TaxID=2923363 RepID=A0ABY4PCV4_9LACO|nr:NAD(P)H-dependent oxidoreductase [Bombilactobacillus thymidiniphilus]UQS83440.1 NAD(P)H-dependent oxidoreductase [Bombilactobacillus thymidiniphilus]